jgi:hypothetical protein
MRLFCLLPVRNGAITLPAYFECIRMFCAGVIALDDGSTDSTLAHLRSEPLVKAILTNPRRATYAGWNDAENRQRLLAACNDFNPDWIFWLDADEHMPSCDVPLFYKFIETCAKTETAYGFEVLRLIGDYHHYDRGKLWAYRTMAYRRGYTLPDRALHFEPVPVQIPRSRWVRTRMRIAHSAGLTAARRRARYSKYRQADRELRWQRSYDHILDPPGHLWEIRPLPPGISLLLQ